jgi:hypothetical protein
MKPLVSAINPFRNLSIVKTWNFFNQISKVISDPST